MKIILINGSSRPNGCTFRALREVAGSLNNEGIETEIVQIGNKAIHGCIGCGGCKRNGKNRCVFTDDIANEVMDKLEAADGLVIGSPVYFSGLTGQLKSLLDRIFSAMDCLNETNSLQYKPGAAVVVCRRGGATATFQQINQFFTISGMPVVSSHYWNQAHGDYDPAQLEEDEEGLQILRSLGRNMAWLVKCIDCGKRNDINPPVREPRVETSFIRNIK